MKSRGITDNGPEEFPSWQEAKTCFDQQPKPIKCSIIKQVRFRQPRDQHSVSEFIVAPRSVSTRHSTIPYSSKNGSTR